MWNLQKTFSLRTFKICRFEIIDGVKYVYCIKHAYIFLLREQLGFAAVLWRLRQCVSCYIYYTNGPVVHEEKIFKFEPTYIPFTQGCFMPNLALNWPRSSWEEDENVKSLWNQRWRQGQWRQTTDKFWSEKLTWAFGSSKLTRHNKGGDGGGWMSLFH